MAVKYWYSAVNANFNTSTCWYASPPTAGGPVGSSVGFSSGNDDAVFTQYSGTATVTIAANIICRSFTTTGFTGTIAGSFQLGINAADASNNAILLGSGTNWTYTGIINLTATSGPYNINFNGITHLGAMYINGAGGSWILTGDITLNGATSLALIDLRNGTFNSNGYTVTINYITASNVTTARSLIMGSSTWNLTSTQNSASVWQFGTPTGLTFDAGTSTIRIISTSNNNVTFQGGGLIYYNFEIARGSSTGTITIGNANNTFTSFKDTTSTAAHTIGFSSGYTQTFDKFEVRGSSTSARISLSSSLGATSPALFVKSTSGVISCDYINLLNGQTSASPANTWYAGANSIGTPIGWILGNPPTARMLLLGVG